MIFTLAALAAALAGGGGFFLGKKLEESDQKEKELTTQQQCFLMAKEGKIDPKLCLKIGQESSLLSELSSTFENAGKLLAGAGILFAVSKLWGKKDE
ncbi:hypothetical protein [Desulfurobacterium atlanticum]|uniref:Uncharacterized protein n=1 Tax=Desulfurobacterium atlanticum TaxID=240169 RepID=A0A238ZJM8_9BACT|nr:hypothetical protein [Desulfurobacterium atlanticum]SNR83490.1 hypothetical protein SAMN06265340_10927 [Desulfurobacterium atlanticum]